MLYAILVTLHLLSAVVWVGGMFFAYLALRPAAQTFEPSVRLPLWSRTFARFFPWVWAAVVLLPLTGYWMVFGYLGGFARVAVFVHIMQALGILMILIYLHVFFVPYRRLNLAVASANFGEAGKQLTQIRKLIGLNLALGLIVIAIVAVGRHA